MVDHLTRWPAAASFSPAQAGDPRGLLGLMANS
jgi:hypothetical protein